MANYVDYYEYKGTNEPPNDNTNPTIYKMNAKLTMGENLADLGGLSLSKKALLKYLKDDLNIKNMIVIKACLRIFFKSWANIWKQNIKEARRLQLLKVDPHAPCDFRGNLVNHIDEFYEVFDIKPSDPMYIPPEQRVVMW